MKTQDWIDCLAAATSRTIVTGETVSQGPNQTAVVEYSLDDAIASVRDRANLFMRRMDGRFIFVGNGGSLAIGAHLATDFGLAGWPSLVLNDSVALTSHTNDFGQDENFAKQLDLLRVQAYDTLIAMSCSGKSPNIIRACQHMAERQAGVITLTGFDGGNPIRKLGRLNFYVPAWQYGIVQLAHESILHAACDMESGVTL